VVAIHRKDHVRWFGGLIGFGARQPRSLAGVRARDIVCARNRVGVDAAFVPLIFGGSVFGADFMGRVVTLASGTVRALVRYWVSISAVTDMPGRKAGSLSLTRMRTSNCVACCDWLLLLLLEVLLPEPTAELATFDTTPVNLRSLKASTSSRAFWPGAMLTTSISPTFTRASIWFKSEMIMISVPAFWTVPRTRSPSCEFSLVMVPSTGERWWSSPVAPPRCPPRPGHVHLVRGAFKLGVGHVARHLERDKVRGRKQFAVEQLQVAVVIRLGLFHAGRGLGLAGHRRGITGLGPIDRRDIDIRFDLHQQIALVDELAFLDRQLGDFAAHFRADGDLHDGLDLAVGHDEVGEAVARNLGGLHRDGRRAVFQNHDHGNC
jgi:hypothetical protein